MVSNHDPAGRRSVPQVIRAAIALGIASLVVTGGAGCRVVRERDAPTPNLPCVVLHISTHITPCELRLSR